MLTPVMFTLAVAIVLKAGMCASGLAFYLCIVGLLTIKKLIVNLQKLTIN